MKTENAFVINTNIIDNNFPKENTIYYNMIVSIDIQDELEPEIIHTKQFKCNKVIFHIKNNKTYIEEVIN